MRSKGTPASSKNQTQSKKGSQIKSVKKGWTVDDYVSEYVSAEEVREIKGAFDIFDPNGSGLVDPVEVKNAFVSLGFANNNKFVYNILSDLDTQYVGGLNFDAFIKLATGRLGQTHTRP